MGKKIAEEKEMSLEDAFSRIEDIMDKLSDDNISLEDSFTLYKNGMEMLGKCKGIIDDVEKKVMVLAQDNNSEDEE